MKLLTYFQLATVSLLVAGLAACGGGSTVSQSGTLRLALTDAPSCGYDAVNVSASMAPGLLVNVHWPLAATLN